jgi:hypothetical protein
MRGMKAPAAVIAALLTLAIGSPASADGSGNSYYRFGNTTVVCSGPLNDRTCQNLDDTIGGRIGANAARSLFCAVFGKDPQCRPAEVPIPAAQDSGPTHSFDIYNVGEPGSPTIAAIL